MIWQVSSQTFNPQHFLRDGNGNLLGGVKHGRFTGTVDELKAIGIALWRMNK